MILSLTTDKITCQAIEGAAGVGVDVDIVVTYTERNQTSGDVGETQRQRTTLSNDTVTDIVGVPGATTTRNIREIKIKNNNADKRVEVLVKFNANGTLYELCSARLLVQCTLEWDMDNGWHQTYGTYEGQTPPERRSNIVDSQDIIQGSASPPSTVSEVPLFQSCIEIKWSIGQSHNWGMFSWFGYTASASTVGLGIMGMGYTSTLKNTMLNTSTNSVTAAALNTTHSNVTSSVASGTSGGATANFGFLGTGGLLSGDNTREVLEPNWLKIASENSGLVQIRQAWCDFFEHTG